MFPALHETKTALGGIGEERDCPLDALKFSWASDRDQMFGEEIAKLTQQRIHESLNSDVERALHLIGAASADYFAKMPQSEVERAGKTDQVSADEVLLGLYDSLLGDGLSLEKANQGHERLRAAHSEALKTIREQGADLRNINEAVAQIMGPTGETGHRAGPN